MNHSKSNFGLVKENSGSRTAMDADETDFLTTADAARFVREKAAREKRPYRVTRSDRTRFCVACADKRCPFQVRFWRRRDGKFHITRNVAHTCTLFQTTVTHVLILVMLDVCFGEPTRFKLFEDRSSSMTIRS